MNRDTASDTAVQSALTFGVLNIPGLGNKLANMVISRESLSKLSQQESFAVNEKITDIYSEALKQEGISEDSAKNYTEQSTANRTSKTASDEHSLTAIPELLQTLNNIQAKKAEAETSSNAANINEQGVIDQSSQAVQQKASTKQQNNTAQQVSAQTSEATETANMAQAKKRTMPITVSEEDIKSVLNQHPILQKELAGVGASKEADNLYQGDTVGSNNIENQNSMQMKDSLGERNNEIGSQSLNDSVLDNSNANALQGDGKDVKIINNKQGNELKTKADILAENRAKGRDFEIEGFNVFRTKWKRAADQVTLKTKSGIKIRADAIGLDANNNVKITEFKSSQTAPLTKNQKKAFPEIKEKGGAVVGKGKGIFIKGYEIPVGTEIEIIRPK